MLILTFVALCYGGFSGSSALPVNYSIWVDTLRVRGTGSDTSKIFWQADVGYKTLQIISDDTSKTGFGTDTSCVSIELYQVFPLGNDKVFMIPSHAHPDSTYWPYSSKFMIADSLNIKAMDTLALKNRVSITRLGFALTDTLSKIYSDAIGSTATQIGAVKYFDLAPSASPGICIILKGKATNSAGAGSRHILRILSIKGTPTFQK